MPSAQSATMTCAMLSALLVFQDEKPAPAFIIEPRRSSASSTHCRTVLETVVPAAVLT